MESVLPLVGSHSSKSSRFGRTWNALKWVLYVDSKALAHSIHRTKHHMYAQTKQNLVRL